MSQRLDFAHDLTYPTAPDTRGSTRVNYKRRPYYMGPYESPLSHVMFGLWKHHLQETGEAPSTKEIRPIAEELLQNGAVTLTDKPLQSDRRGYYLAAIGFTLVFFLSLHILFSPSPITVDGIAVSETEVEFIRGVRLQEAKISNLPARTSEVTSTLADELTNEGLKHGAVQIPKRIH